MITTPFLGYLFNSFGAPGVEFYGQLPKDKIICSLHFVPGHVLFYFILKITRRFYKREYGFRDVLLLFVKTIHSNSGNYHLMEAHC